MRFIEPSHYTDPDAAASKLLEIAHTAEAVQDGRIHIELINEPFLEAGTPAEYRAGLAARSPRAGYGGMSPGV